ncbi:MAG TPA: nucleoside hydrolase-like domain-containing protein, partial [Chitinophagaceae bacterium]|nr:nucleoside hydrolase-like domain-containing protein [Chitinophagaceae bacterium]
CCLFLIVSTRTIFSQGAVVRPRTVVTTDGEVDDQDSFMRLLLYSNELKIDGLVYTSSQWHYKGDGKGTKFTSEMPMTKKMYGERTELRWIGTEWMQSLIDKYAKVYSNLLKHDRNFPTPQYLKSVIRVGNIDFEGEMDRDTPGSDLIKKILLDEGREPVYLQMWGGTNTVARALKSIEDTYKRTNRWQSIYKKVSQKAVLYIILDQDAAYKKYVESNWPDIKVLYNSSQFWSFAYFWSRAVPQELQIYFKGTWMADHIKFNHGPLLSSYFVWGDGQKVNGDPDDTPGDTAQARKNGFDQFDFSSEGDSPSFFYLINTGLRNLEDASYGGWGGRMVRSSTNLQKWEDGTNVTDYNPYTKKNDISYPQTRWVEALQNDFAARADWCVNNYSKANHSPIVKLNHAANISGKPGSLIKLSASAHDPDRNDVSYHWWEYEEADTYAGKIEIQNSQSNDASFTVPSDAKTGDTIHIIVQVKDAGTPPLTRYQRVIVTVK